MRLITKESKEKESSDIRLDSHKAERKTLETVSAGRGKGEMFRTGQVFSPYGARLLRNGLRMVSLGPWEETRNKSLKSDDRHSVSRPGPADTPQKVK